MDHFCCLSLYLPFCDICFLQRCQLLGKGWLLGLLVCEVFIWFVTFPFGVLGQVWYLYRFLIFAFFLTLNRLCSFVQFHSSRSSQQFFSYVGQYFLGWTCTKQRLLCLPQRHKAVNPARLEPASSWSRVKQSTTEPLPSLECVAPFVFNFVDKCFNFIFFRMVLSEKQKLT